MLYVNGTLLSSISLEMIHGLACMQQATSNFLQQLDSSSTVPDNNGPYLCLMQGEEACVDSRQLPGLVIGSQDATTCMVAIISCPATQLVWCAHLDQQLLGKDDVTLLLDSLSNMQQPQLYLAGAYCDTKSLGPATAQAFLQLLHSLQVAIHLQLACVAAANTAPDGSPHSCCLVLDTASQTPYPWVFANRGPEVPRRLAAQHCRWHSNHLLLNIWCPQQRALALPAFDATCLSSWQVMQHERLLWLPDAQLLQLISTSPEHEPAWFVQDMRAMLQFLVEAQEPDSEQRRAASSAAHYGWCSASSSWQPLKAAAAVAAAVPAGGAEPAEAMA
ncbi:N-terminal asparagine amidohydrolase-domain-containing protein [Scenedesmus sp. NREL 46B-D3]|nr:N-terminal asparagine amidohydrolase-domain-containing protein [Scenedesmus sp. NREL 46B-D3]